jgi:uncharacterized membrane protein
MAPATNIIGVLLALTSAFVWGSGDFTGGYASRRSSPFYVLVISALSGLVVLIAAGLLLREGFPSLRGTIWSALAGLAGALGIAAFYRALSIGRAASIAPTTGVISAALPAVFGAVTQGLPAVSRLVGFGLALVGIWLVSANAKEQGPFSRQGLLLAILAGIGFGCFFITIGQVDPGKYFTPLIVSRCLTFLTGLLLVRLNRMSFPALNSNPLALLAGVLDAGGNLFYILAKQYTRLDVAAVLASLYPAATVLLASLILKEKISIVQWLGVLICLAAIALITL